jgi:tetratricopeptide (TPR) repeat protein
VNSTTSIPKPIPDLDRVLSKSPLATMVTAEDVSRSGVKIKELQTFLKSNPSVFPAWIDLGAYQKNAGDYDGAIISWTYASKLLPTDYVALGNIGNLYGFFMKNPEMSANYYKQAIKRDPRQSYLYAQLAEVYEYIAKDKNKAIAILKEGLKAIPNDPNLTELLRNLEDSK